MVLFMGKNYVKTPDGTVLSNKFTYGVELEWVDCDARTHIPPHLGSWNFLDFTMVNSDGHAVDPNLIFTTKGAEINTRPTSTIQEQIEIIKELKKLLPDATTNYRCLTHIHIGVPGLENNIDGLLKIFKYIEANQDYVYDVILKHEPESFEDKLDSKMSRIYNKRLYRWCKQKTDRDKVESILQSTTPLEFSSRHYNSLQEQQNGGLLRSGINILSVFKHKTVEFRCFPGTMDLEEYRSCFQFASEFVWNALYYPEWTVKDMYENEKWNFPKWQKFDSELEKGYLRSRKKIVEYEKNFINS